MGSSRHYLPAAGHDWLLPLYDPLVSLLGGDTAREVLLDQAAIRPTDRILDIGCGTGTLAVLIKRQHAEVQVVGVDPDPKALARARRKAERAGVSVQFEQGYSEELPHGTASFDRVFSSFMLHHLPVPAKERTLQGVRRVLAPGGLLHVLDFGAEDRLLALLREAGFTDAKVVARQPILFASLAYYQASAPAPKAGVAPPA